VPLRVGNKLVVANAGDSRAVLCRRGQAVEMSRDHKPMDEDERARIQKAGGFVQEGRVNGSLALSRAIGDLARLYKLNSVDP
jgi:serine/threonine protein phosphatase PrpC